MPAPPSRDARSQRSAEHARQNADYEHLEKAVRALLGVVGGKQLRPGVHVSNLAFPIDEELAAAKE